ncbi:uncharacterized protein LOC143575857 [Bidens hawaiensis]|uniref:uncharacterized protein LOC143575857 n=1 Tax=Bidens hawaiensis TaxID=980011 RepID=UPI00404935FF
MMQKNPDSITQNKGACNVTLADFDHDKPLAYVNCNNCNQRAHLHEKSKFVCLDHWDDYGVKCMYCVNTIIKDKDTTAKAIFFDEAMTDMLETTCEEMIMKRGYKDTKLIPDEIIALQGQHCQLQMTIKKDKSIAVNRAKKFIQNPPTPAKTTGMKRPPPDSPGKYYNHQLQNSSTLNTNFKINLNR